ncbi:hypothetical protein [Kitasatospora mediocidica]|uniref:hypothetical protein n=1 Tax=Kitasatospora mediocidica TaxID=58352 RepID=UPI000A84E162|nr:hypothetical protein [Kitasatospora mediocidica]
MSLVDGYYQVRAWFCLEVGGERWEVSRRLRGELEPWERLVLVGRAPDRRR